MKQLAFLMLCVLVVVAVACSASGSTWTATVTYSPTVTPSMLKADSEPEGEQCIIGDDGTVWVVDGEGEVREME